MPWGIPALALEKPWTLASQSFAVAGDKKLFTSCRYGISLEIASESTVAAEYRQPLEAQRKGCR